MLSTVISASTLGIDAVFVQVEVDLGRGMPHFAIVGLPDQAVRESRQRVKSAIRNSGYRFRSQRIIVNLAPADLKKEGPSFDLPTAIGILTSLGYVRRQALERLVFVGELALDGTLRKVKGVLPITLLVGKTHRALVIPEENQEEAALVRGATVYGAPSLQAVVAFLNGQKILEPIASSKEECDSASAVYPFDFKEVKGQFHAKRALEVAVCGAHNLLLIGPPGSGKTMLARRIPSILPPLSSEEAIEVTKIYSVAGLFPNGGPRLLRRPFRSPHHTVSAAGLAGGGSFPRPGEVSLAHYGVLFLDEFPEFRRDALEILRGPLEDGELTVARAKASVRFPARFMLVAAMNPCKCGFLGDSKRPCRCHPSQISAYRSKISGPLLDRIDIQIEVPSVSYGDLVREASAEDSETIRQRVQHVRKIQCERFRSEDYQTNSEINEKDIPKYCTLILSGKRLLEQAMTELSLSARAYTRILKVSRTLADMAGSDRILEEHIAEAIQYRILDRQL